MTDPERNPLEIVSEVTEFNDLSEFMNDAVLDEVLSKVIKLIVKPDVPAPKIAALIVQLQASSAKFSMLATVYATIKKDRAGTDNNNKKNIYYTAAKAIDDFVGALKYMSRI